MIENYLFYITLLKNASAIILLIRNAPVCHPIVFLILTYQNPTLMKIAFLLICLIIIEQLALQF